MELYANSYYALRTEVNSFNGLIPHSSIRAYATELGLRGNEYERFRLIVLSIHEAVCERDKEKRDAELAGTKGTKGKTNGISRSIRPENFGRR